MQPPKRVLIMISQRFEPEDVYARHSPQEHLKRCLSAALVAEMAEFIANGGKVTIVPPGVIADAAPSEWTKGVMRV